MGRMPEYEVKKERFVGWCHPKTIKWIERRAKRENCTLGKVLDKMKAEQ